MFSATSLLLVLMGYMGLLFLIAYGVERKAAGGHDFAANRWVYTLSLSVYCTAWTFYGSVGYAAENGLLFLAIYLGSTLSMLLGWSVLRKMIRLKNVHRLTSIADLISARYGRSQGLAFLSTVIVLFGVLPYIALQLKAILTSTHLLLGGGSGQALPAIGIPVAISITVFTIFFGLRKLAPTERHPGVIVALSFECVFKLIAFLAVGTFVVWKLGHGIPNLLARSPELLHADTPFVGGSVSGSPFRWFCHMILGGAAILFLPRSFHVSVVENTDEDHLRTAIWGFPFYLLLINLFVLPIALTGLYLGIPRFEADSFVLAIPLQIGPAWLTLLVFLGGFSAALGMISLETIAIATMISNHLFLPLIDAFPSLRGLRKSVLQVRWVAAALIILASYAYSQWLGGKSSLVNLGMVSFVAILQFAPVVIGGLFWRLGNRAGAYLGLIAGFGIWAYTLIVPTLSDTLFLPRSILEIGPFGIAALRPTELFGSSGLDPLSHAVFWSMTFNILLYVCGSLAFETSPHEQLTQDEFVDILKSSHQARPPAPLRLPYTVDAALKLGRIREILGEYLDTAEAERRALLCFSAAGLRPDHRFSVIELSELQNEVARCLAGIIGSAEAYRAVKASELVSAAEESDLSHHYAEIISAMKLSPTEVWRRLEVLRERETLLLEQAVERERLLAKETAAKAEAETATRVRDEFISIASHELKTPLTPLLLQVQGLRRIIEKSADSGRSLPDGFEGLLANSERQVQRIQHLVENLLDISRISTGRLTLNRELFDLSALIRELVSRLQATGPSRVDLNLVPAFMVYWDRLRTEQVLVNLITNAMKFGEGKPIQVSVRANGHRAVILVRDFGIGIAKESQERIFNKFEQASSAITYGGLGLGLYISRQIVEAHHGKIFVSSKPGEGAIFNVEIPLGQDPHLV